MERNPGLTASRLAELVPHIVALTALHAGVHYSLTHLGLLELLLGPEKTKIMDTPDAPPPAVEAASASTKKNKKKKLQNGFDRRHGTALDIVSSTTSVLLFVMYGFSALGLKDTAETRVGGITNLSYWSLMTHLGYTAYESLLYLCMEKWGTGKDALMYIHHACVLANLVPVLCTNRLHFYSCWMGLVEGTNPCLSGVFFFPRINMKDSIFLTISGVMLFLGFLFLRVIPLPYIFYCVMKDWDTLDWSMASSAWAYCFGSVSIIFLWCLSTFWFYRIALGMFKTLGWIKPKAKKDA